MAAREWVSSHSLYNQRAKKLRFILTVLLTFWSARTFAICAQVENAVLNVFPLELHQSAGIIANIQAESNCKHDAVGDQGRAVGLLQLHLPRQKDFKAVMGMDIKESGIPEQITYAMLSSSSGEYGYVMNLMSSSKTACEAGRIWSLHYERPKRKRHEAKKRCELAETIYGRMK